MTKRRRTPEMIVHAERQMMRRLKMWLRKARREIWTGSRGVRGFQAGSSGATMVDDEKETDIW
jgi:hypothetical protein